MLGYQQGKVKGAWWGVNMNKAQWSTCVEIYMHENPHA